jgi:hypothetical protein
MLAVLTHAFGFRRLFVHAEGQSSKSMWGDWGLVMGFVEDVKRGRMLVGL